VSNPKNVKKETNPPAYCSHSFDGCHVFYLFKNHKFVCDIVLFRRVAF
jgi:hypothetical protein